MPAGSLPMSSSPAVSHRDRSLGQGFTRRAWIAGLFGTYACSAAPRPEGMIVDTHVHLFASDKTRFPYHPNAPYAPPAADLRAYKMFLDRSKLNHAVIVHPEPYQDDHRYLEHCLKNEPSPGFFKGTCLFDPIAPDTPDRLDELFQRYPGRIVAFRIHEMGERGSEPETSGAIKNRDLQHAGMKNTFHKCHELGLAVQMHFLPHYATRIFDLASQFEGVPLILDHLGRAGQGTPAEFEEVLRLARLPRCYMKFSGVNYSSQQGPPHADAKPIVRKILDAFGPDRIIWGGLGQSIDQFDQAVQIFEMQLSDLSDADRAKICGLNAMKLFGFAS